MKLEPTLSQSLHLLNGDTVEPKIAQGNLIGKMLAGEEDAGADHRGAVRPLPEPQAEAGRVEEPARRMVDAAKDKKQALEDVFWAILNSREFMFNH